MDITALLQNKLLLQYLSAAGMDISSGNVIGANTNQVTQQNISAQNYANMLKTVLSGGGKMSMDKDSLTLKGPVGAFQGPQGPGTSSSLAVPQENIGLQGQGGTAGVNTGITKLSKTPKIEDTSETDLLSALLKMSASTVGNPPSSPLGDLSAADLAGLTPQDISQALQFKFAQEQAGEQRVNDLFNNAYKIALMQQMKDEAATKQQENTYKFLQTIRPSTFGLPGVPGLTFEEWDNLPTDVKAYSYYYFDAMQNKSEKILTYDEFRRDTSGGVQIEYYKYASKDPEFKKWLKEMNESSATKLTLGEKSQWEREKEWIDFDTSLPDKIDKLVNSDAVQNAIFSEDWKKLLEDDGKTPKYTTEEDFVADQKAQYIERQIRVRAEPGTPIERSLSEDGIMTWKFKTKMGRMESISYDLYH